MVHGDRADGAFVLSLKPRPPPDRRPVHFTGCKACELWCMTVPVMPVPLLLLTGTYCNRFQMSVITAWEWRGKAKVFAEALEAELRRPAQETVDCAEMVE